LFLRELDGEDCRFRYFAAQTAEQAEVETSESRAGIGTDVEDRLRLHEDGKRQMCAYAPRHFHCQNYHLVVVPATQLRFAEVRIESQIRPENVGSFTPDCTDRIKLIALLKLAEDVAEANLPQNCSIDDAGIADPTSQSDRRNEVGERMVRLIVQLCQQGA